MKCSNIKCSNEFSEDEGYETGTPSGYADDYIFCNNCAPVVKKHFDIAGWHDGGMVSEPPCQARLDKPEISHTCPFSEKELNEAKLAFRNYR
jgi:hypothetical protein